MALESELSEEPVSVEMVDMLLSKFKPEMFDCLLFVNHVKSITVSEVSVRCFMLIDITNKTCLEVIVIIFCKPLSARCWSYFRGGLINRFHSTQTLQL